MTRWRRLIRWASGRPHLAAYLLFIGINASAMWTLSNVVQDNEAVVQDNEAQRCIDDWELFNAVRVIGPVSNEALIEAFPNADPADVTAVREATARRIDALIDDPSCDLDAARRRLD